MQMNSLNLQLQAQLAALTTESRDLVEEALVGAVGVRRGNSAIGTTPTTVLTDGMDESKTYAVNTSPESREAKRRRRQMEKRNVR